jgi:hypothetical protein
MKGWRIFRWVSFTWLDRRMNTLISAYFKAPLLSVIFTRPFGGFLPWILLEGTCSAHCPTDKIWSNGHLSRNFVFDSRWFLLLFAISLLKDTIARASISILFSTPRKRLCAFHTFGDCTAERVLSYKSWERKSFDFTYFYLSTLC